MLVQIKFQKMSWKCTLNDFSPFPNVIKRIDAFMFIPYIKPTVPWLAWKIFLCLSETKAKESNCALCQNRVMTGNGSFRLSVLWQLGLAQLYGDSEQMQCANWHQINQNELWSHFSLLKCFSVTAFGLCRTWHI